MKQVPDVNMNNQALDPILRNGPVENRKCRDICCYLIFLMSCIAMIVIFSYSINNGNPSKLAKPYDSSGKQCGDKGTSYESYKYLYYATPLPSLLSRTICVKECPISNTTIVDCKSITYADLSADQKATGHFSASFAIGSNDVCKFQYSDSLFSGDITSKLTSTTSLLSYNTAFWIYNSVSLFDRVCVPFSSSVIGYASSLFDNIKDELNNLEKWIADIKLTWPIILASAGFALIFGFAYMILMRFCVGVMVWLGIFLYFAALAIISAFFYKRGKEIQDNQSRENVDQSSIDSQLIIAYILWAVIGLSLLILMCFYTRIKLAIAIMKTGSQYVTDVKTALIVPIITSIILIGFWVIWVIGLIYGYSIGTIKVNSYGFSTVKWESQTRYMLVYYVFGGLWKNAFIQAVEQFVLAHSVCLWYFSKGAGGQQLHSPIRKGLGRALWYHCGSLAFGSLILAIVQMMRIILTYIQSICSKNKLSENKFIKCFLWSTQCYLACLERFIKFINKNAYIQIALSGKNFCLAAKDAFSIIMENPLRFASVATIGTIFLFLGKVFISACAACVGYLIITKVDYYNKQLFSAFLPTLLMAIVAFSVGILFMSIYGMAINSILHCFILDEQLAKQHGGQQVYTPEYLRDFIDKHQQSNSVKPQQQ